MRWTGSAVVTKAIRRSAALWAQQREGGEQPCEQDRPVVTGGARARCGRGGTRHVRWRVGRGPVAPVGGDRSAQRRMGRQQHYAHQSRLIIAKACLHQNEHRNQIQFAGQNRRNWTGYVPPAQVL